MARISWKTAEAYMLVWRSCFFSSSTKRLSSSEATVERRFFFSTRRFPKGPPIRLPVIRPKVAAAVQMVVAPWILKSSSTGPKAPAVPCPPTIGMEPVHIPINGFNPNSLDNPTARKFWVIIRVMTSPKNTAMDFPPLFKTFKLA